MPEPEPTVGLVGAAVGAVVVAAAVGAGLGSAVVGLAVGEAGVGAEVGSAVVGFAVGLGVVGAGVRAAVGAAVGACTGAAVVGVPVGAGVGASVQIPHASGHAALKAIESSSRFKSSQNCSDAPWFEHGTVTSPPKIGTSSAESLQGPVGGGVGADDAGVGADDAGGGAVGWVGAVVSTSLAPQSGVAEGSQLRYGAKLPSARTTTALMPSTSLLAQFPAV